MSPQAVLCDTQEPCVVTSALTLIAGCAPAAGPGTPAPAPRGQALTLRQAVGAQGQ